MDVKGADRGGRTNSMFIAELRERLTRAVLARRVR